MLAWIVDHWTLLMVAALALLFYGSRLPEVARSLGRSVSEFKKGLRDIEGEIGRDDKDEPPGERRKLHPPPEQAQDQPTAERDKVPVAQGEKTPEDKA